MLSKTKFSRNVQIQFIESNNILSIPEKLGTDNLNIIAKLYCQSDNKNKNSSVTIFNLNNEHMNYVIEKKDILDINVLAGYGEDLSIVYSGGIDKIKTGKENNNNYIKIYIKYSKDNFKIKHMNRAYAGDIEIKQIIKDYLNYCNVTYLYLDKIPTKIVKNYSVYLSLQKTLNNLLSNTDVSWMIHNKSVIFFEKNIKQTTFALEINPDNGMISSPRIKDNLILIDILFEPSLFIGDFISLKSNNINLNGIYKIENCEYHLSTNDKNMNTRLECKKYE